MSKVRKKPADATETWVRLDPGSTEDQPGCTSPGLTYLMTPSRCKPQGLELVAKGCMRLMKGAAIPVLPEPDPAPGIPHWDTMSLEKLVPSQGSRDSHRRQGDPQ